MLMAGGRLLHNGENGQDVVPLLGKWNANEKRKGGKES